jgi:biopolymer transport protein ExbD
MKCLLSVCLAILAGVAIFAVGGRGQVPALQKGVSVQMATSSNAVPMPEADNENAWVVAVTADARIYFGTDEVTSDGLTEQMKIHPRNRGAKIYVKADARAPFRSVRQVLRAAREDLFDDVILLTSQPESAQPGAAQSGTTVPPKGLEVWVGTESESNLVVVQIGSREGSSTLKINNEDVSPSALQDRLGQLFDNRAGRIVVLKATGQVPYAKVVHAIDACLAAGASRISITVSSEV